MLSFTPFPLYCIYIRAYVICAVMLLSFFISVYTAISASMSTICVSASGIDTHGCSLCRNLLLPLGVVFLQLMSRMQHAGRD